MTTSFARLRDSFVDGVDPRSALFCTYGFDAPFFEAEVLAATFPVRLSLDRESGSRAAYLSAADAAMQAAPVLVFFDHLTGDGPGLPYIPVRVGIGAAFHPKLILLEYEDRFRAVVSSANLTRPAWTSLLELFVVEDIRPGDPHPWSETLQRFLERLETFVPTERREEVTRLRSALATVPAGGTGPRLLSSTEERVYPKNLERGRLLTDVWEDIPHIANWSSEKVGYPTQKPEALLDRIIRAASCPEDVVADFFCGGGTTAAVAERLDRRWIACDISRVAVSITADRVAKIAEERESAAKTAGKTTAIPDFIVANWGIYEIANLSQMAPHDFSGFVLAAYNARPETTSSIIHGYKGKQPIYVGPPDPDVPVRKEDVAEFANAVLNRLGSGGTGTMIAWAFTEVAQRMAERIAAQEKVRLQFVRLRLVPLESPEFVADVTSKHERYSRLVSFVLPPAIRLNTRHVSTRTYRFDVSETIALNSGAKIINVQWDFDYRDYFTSTPGFEYGRTKRGEPVLTAEYEFPGPGDYAVAVRVQDDLGGEAILRETVRVL